MRTYNHFLCFWFLKFNALDLVIRYIPTKNQNMILESIDESRFIESQTQLSDTNVVETIDFEK